MVYNPVEFVAGDVVMAVHDIPGMLRRGHLYRIRDQVPHHAAYRLEGVEAAGFWSLHFERPRLRYTRAGPIRLLPRGQGGN